MYTKAHVVPADRMISGDIVHRRAPVECICQRLQPLHQSHLELLSYLFGQLHGGH
jgi:hypothetical protein